MYVTHLGGSLDGFFVLNDGRAVLLAAEKVVSPLLRLLRLDGVLVRESVRLLLFQLPRLQQALSFLLVVLQLGLL